MARVRVTVAYAVMLICVTTVLAALGPALAELLWRSARLVVAVVVGHVGATVPRCWS